MRILTCSGCGAAFGVEGTPGAGGVVCPECGTRLAGGSAADVVIDVSARPVGAEAEAEAAAEAAAARAAATRDRERSAPIGDDVITVEVEESPGGGFYRRTVRGPGGSFRFETIRSVQGGQGCFTCGCIVVILAIFLMLRGCASLF